MDHVWDQPDAASVLWLKPSDDGWSLIRRDGVVMFRGLGLTSRRQCLQRAHDLGVLTVFG